MASAPHATLPAYQRACSERHVAAEKTVNSRGGYGYSLGPIENAEKGGPTGEAKLDDLIACSALYQSTSGDPIGRPLSTQYS